MTSNPPSKDNHSTILKETREQRGISLEMVHEATKIPLDALKAIEQGYSVHRLSPFYYRGFIRIYCKYLEVDETKILQSYGIQETAAPKPQPVAAPREVRPRGKMTPQAIPADDFVKDTLRPLIKRNLTGARLQQIVKFIVLLVAVFFVFKMIGCIVHKGKEPKPPATVKNTEKKFVVAAPVVKPSSKDKSKPKKEETSSVSKAEHSSVEKVAASAAVTEAAPVKVQESKPDVKADKKAKRIELTVRAAKSGWLQVKADGQVVFQSTLKKGAAETWSASEEIELSGKNINLLEFELNGKMLGALGPSDRGAKRVVFTKDGLSVKK